MASGILLQGESILMELGGTGTSSVAIVSRTGNHAGTNLVLEAMIDSEWITPITMVDPAVNPKAEIAAVTGPAKSGWADLPGFRKARVRRTDANGGAGLVEFNARRL